MRKGDGLRGKGATPGSVAETGSSEETAEGHVGRYFGAGEGAAATEIWKA